MSKNVTATKEMINEELLCIEHHTKCGILCECIKAKPELNERMINYNIALIKRDVLISVLKSGTLLNFSITIRSNAFHIFGPVTRID